LDIPLSRLHPTVSLAEEVLLENAGKRTEMSDATKAFRAAGKPSAELFAEASAIRSRFHRGGWILGGFVGLILCLKLIGLFIRRKQPEYDVDKGTCFSCGRCFAYCPYEQVRLGLITPEQLKELDRREVKIKQFRA
jgi:ferredoxin